MMGMWGTEPFENDTALDVLGNVIGTIKSTINNDLKNAGTRSGKGVLLRPTLACVKMLVALVDGIPSARSYLMKNEVRSWQDRYQKWFDESFSDNVDKQTAEECRKHTRSAFQQLLRRASDAEV